MHKSFWLGLIGGIFGISASIGVIFLGGLEEAFGAGAGELYGLGFAAMIFSVIGMVGGILEKNKAIGGTLMVASGIVVLICISLYGVLTFVFFLIGGVIYLIEWRKEAQFSTKVRNETTVKQSTTSDELDETDAIIVRRCSKCHTVLEDDWAVCPKCKSVFRKKCPDCERILPKNFEACPYCGHDFGN